MELKKSAQKINVITSRICKNKQCQQRNTRGAHHEKYINININEHERLT
jgi:hypothetical protein